MWHASVAKISGDRVFTTYERKEAKRLCRMLLQGVGTGESAWDPKAGFLHFRKPLSEKELSKIPDEWHALPAVDPA